jgi:tetratricopeptide (TPR) repeat protein
MDEIVFSYNRKAMEHLRNEDYKTALNYLTQAEKLLSTKNILGINKLYGITLNNFGCFYKRTGNPNLALNFLRKALEIETKPPVDTNNLAGTHLNMCAILSQIEDHQKALTHALKALNLLKSKYLEDSSLITTLLVAYHNAGVEYEFLSQIPEANQIYKKGWELANNTFGEAHPLALNLKKNMKNTSYPRRTGSNASDVVSPIIRSRASVPRAYKISEKNTPQKSVSATRDDSVRFITGERLQPMFKKDYMVLKKDSGKNKYDVKGLIKELNPNYSKKYKVDDKKNDFNESSSKFSDLRENDTFVDSKDLQESLEYSARTISNQNNTPDSTNIATQVNFYDRNLYKKVKNKAAIVIQKYCRSFLAKKKFEYKKYSKQLEEAEKQAKIAKEKLNSLNNKRKLSLTTQKPSELIPIVYKDKLNSPLKAATGTNKKFKGLSIIPEENDAYFYKLTSIQKHVRGWVVRKEFIFKKKAVITIQKHVKRYQIRLLYLQIREAIIFIQRFWRYWKKHQKHKQISKKRIVPIKKNFRKL